MSHDETESADTGVDRRTLMAALGAGGSLAVAGCAGLSSGSTGGDEVDSRFGYTATDPEEEPPVEPDHTVDLKFRPRDDAPVPEFFFEPTGLAIDVGDTVKFNLATPHHNVNAYHPGFGYTQRVPDGVPAFSSPMLTGGCYWLYTFDTEGVHDVTCAPHEIFGMAGRIVVGDATGPGANPVGEAPAPSEESRPPEFTAGLVLSDPALDPEAVLDAGSVSWSEIAAENKRLMVAPTGGSGGEGSE